jgi:hypothetical protein
MGKRIRTYLPDWESILEPAKLSQSKVQVLFALATQETHMDDIWFVQLGVLCELGLRRRHSH